MRVDALQLVHDGADVLHALRHLDAQTLLDAHAEGVAVLRGPEVVEAVGQRQRLGVGQALAHLLDAAVDVAAVDVELADNLTLERDAEAQHAVRGGVLGTDVDDILALLEQEAALADEAAVGHQLERGGAVARDLVAHAQRVERLVVVLAQGVAHPVVTQVEAPHVGVVQEADAEVVEDLAFVELGTLPQVAHRGEHPLRAVGRERAQHDILARRGRFEVIDRADALLAPVDTREAAQEVESRLVTEPRGKVVEPPRGNGVEAVALVGPDGRRLPGRYFFVERHILFHFLFSS